MQDPFLIIIIFSFLIIFSYFFIQIARVTKIPAVIFLIGTGVLIQYFAKYSGFEIPDLSQPLRLLGIVGLIMIVLEGALDLQLQKSKIRMMLAAVATSAFILAITNAIIAGILMLALKDLDFKTAFLYAIPLSVVSSAIVISSVHQLTPIKKEFMILESTLSDIFGIMLFEFWIYEPLPNETYVEAISWNIGISVVVSILLSYLLVYVFHKIKTEIKFFLFLSILALLYAVGEYMHYSALLIILIFGVILNNTTVFFRGFLKKIIDAAQIKSIKHEFVIITNESSFLIRTFFFVVFGMTMKLDGLLNYKSIVIAMAIMMVIFLIRAFNLKVFIKSTIFPQMLIAPRGLVTILLFNKIIEHYGVVPFDEAILALVIIGSNLMMMVGLMIGDRKEDHDPSEISDGNAPSPSTESIAPPSSNEGASL